MCGVCTVFLLGGVAEKPKSGHQGSEAEREKYLGKPGIQPRLVYNVFYGVAISLTFIPWPVSVGYQRSSIHSISPFFRFATFIL